MKVYLAGPMTGYPEKNYPAFMRMAKRLRKRGHKVINPAELNGPEVSWEAAMHVNLAALQSCEAVYVLPGWERSKGALIEVAFAIKHDMPVRRASRL